MNPIFTIALILFTMNSQTVFDFNKSSNISNWFVLNDTVMGGKSSATFKINDAGHAAFTGVISLDNNGGFSSVRYDTGQLNVKGFSKICVTLKGDGKDYQLRIKHRDRQRYSYIKGFSTSGEWQTIEIDLNAMYPTFRGRNVDRPNFAEDSIEELAFLIGNKKEERFELLIDKISLN